MRRIACATTLIEKKKLYGFCIKQSHKSKKKKKKEEHRVCEFCNSTNFIPLVLGRCEMPFCDRSLRSQLFLCSGSSDENVTLSHYDMLYCARH